jgi:DNA-3-methyladenine glycosylase
MHHPAPLAREALPADTVALARFLIGRMVVRALPEGIAAARIVETEAYLVGDAASHAYRGMTPRNRSMFLERGHAYVYLAYGTSFMLNVASATTGVGEAVLVRAAEPVSGIAVMEHRRGTTALRDLARGPGRLAQALGIDRALDGIDLCAPGPLWLAADAESLGGRARASGEEGGPIGVSARIGITKDAERPLRFYLRGSRFVSGPRSLSP